MILNSFPSPGRRVALRPAVGGHARDDRPAGAPQGVPPGRFLFFIGILDGISMIFGWNLNEF